MNGNEDGAGKQLACDCYMLSYHFSVFANHGQANTERTTTKTTTTTTTTTCCAKTVCGSLTCSNFVSTKYFLLPALTWAWAPTWASHDDYYDHDKDKRPTDTRLEHWRQQVVYHFVPLCVFIHSPPLQWLASRRKRKPGWLEFHTSLTFIYIHHANVTVCHPSVKMLLKTYSSSLGGAFKSLKSKRDSSNMRRHMM